MVRKKREKINEWKCMDGGREWEREGCMARKKGGKMEERK
jgi:hypothetical protein